MAGWDSGLTEAVLAASAAATNPDRWDSALDALCTRFGATSAAIHTPRGAPAGKPLFVDVGLPKHTVPDYIDYWSPQDPWFAGAAARQICVQTGQCGIGSELIDWADLKRLDYYHEFAAPTGVQSLLAMIVDDGSQPAAAPLTVIGLYRRPGMEEFTYDDKRSFEAVHAPLQLALRAHWSQIRSGLSEQASTSVFEVIPKPLLVLSGSGDVLYANPLGHLLLTKGNLLGIYQGKIQRLGQLANESVQAALRAVEAGFVQTFPIFSSKALSQTPPAIARLTPLPEDNVCRIIWPGATTLLMIDEPQSNHREQQLTAFSSHYRLTKAERRLVEGLADGLRLTEFAEQFEVSIHTVRAHLQNIFTKTGVRRQSELIRVVSAFIS